MGAACEHGRILPPPYHAEFLLQPVTFIYQQTPSLRYAVPGHACLRCLSHASILLSLYPSPSCYISSSLSLHHLLGHMPVLASPFCFSSLSHLPKDLHLHTHSHTLQQCSYMHFTLHCAFGGRWCCLGQAYHVAMFRHGWTGLLWVNVLWVLLGVSLGVTCLDIALQPLPLPLDLEKFAPHCTHIAPEKHFPHFWTLPCWDISCLAASPTHLFSSYTPPHYPHTFVAPFTFCLCLRAYTS